VTRLFRNCASDKTFATEIKRAAAAKRIDNNEFEGIILWFDNHCDDKFFHGQDYNPIIASKIKYYGAI